MRGTTMRPTEEPVVAGAEPRRSPDFVRSSDRGNAPVSAAPQPCPPGHRWAATCCAIVALGAASYCPSHPGRHAATPLNNDYA
jgi:hypothetical protein